MILLAIAGHSLGLLTGILLKDAGRVSVIIPMIMIPFLLFAGVFNNLNDLPRWVSWIQYLTPMKYGTHSLMLN